MPEKLTKAAERKLLSAIDTIVAETTAGKDLHDSCYKVASESDLTEDQVRLLCRTYNAGAVNHQRENTGEGSILAKLAQVALLDPDVVIGRMEQTKSAADDSTVISDCYSRPPQRVEPAVLRRKVASATPTPSAPPERKMSIAEVAGRGRETLKRAQQELTPIKMAFLAAFGQFADSVRDSRISDGELLGACELLDPAAGGKIAAAVIDRNAGTAETSRKVASTTPTFLLDVEAKPFCYLADVVKTANEYVRAKQDYAKGAILLKLKVAELVEEHSGDFKSILPGHVRWNKMAGDMMTYVLGSNLARVGADSLLKTPDDREAKIQSEMNTLNDPAHDNELRKYRSEAMMHSLMNDDEVLSGYKPEQIAEAYNELSQLSPRAAQQPVLARSILRKWLPQGGVDTFEAKDIADTEKVLAGTQPKVASESPLFRDETYSILRR